MRYTLWSRGRLLGETELGFIFRDLGCRCGWLHPTELGERLMAAATDVPPAMRMRWLIGADATARADLAAALDREQALELQLRGPDGAVIATENIGIIDTHYLLSLAAAGHRDEVLLDPEQEAEIEALLDFWGGNDDTAGFVTASEGESEFPRYQIQVALVDPSSVP